MILYPQYPEVRLSGFLLGSTDAPSEILNDSQVGRAVIFGIHRDGKVYGYVASANSLLVQDIFNRNLPTSGLFLEYDICKKVLLQELQKIHQCGWLDSIKLDKAGNEVSYRGKNGGGYTLEAKLGIKPNSKTEPDFCGWEIKQYSQSGQTITLITPEPTGGLYIDQGAKEFIMQFGYQDKKGKPDRLNFSTPHKYGHIHPSTKLKLTIRGYENGKILDIQNGGIVLEDNNNNPAAIWHFAQLMHHWKNKHSRAVYVPSIRRNIPSHQYHYINTIKLCEETDFLLFLQSIQDGYVYYDPGIKMENTSGIPKIKKRSQFRIKYEDVNHLYQNSKTVNLDIDV